MAIPSGGKRKDRVSRKKILDMLMSNGWSQASELTHLPPLRAINLLFPLLYHGDIAIKSRAVAVFGAAVARLAETDMERARNVIRRLMWSLNDESGSIGWGSPEAMGETLALHKGLAAEYAHILSSYTRPEANYLENEVLQKGLLWAISRLRGTSPELVLKTDPHILPYLGSADAGVRGLAAGLLGELGDAKACPYLTRLLEDNSEYENPMDPFQTRRRVKDAAREALGKISNFH